MLGTNPLVQALIIDEKPRRLKKKRGDRKMELPLNQKLERAVSSRALQMGSSFPCQICVLGFFCGVCLTYLFMASLTSFGAFEVGRVSFPVISMAGVSSYSNSSSETLYCNFGGTETKRRKDSMKDNQSKKEKINDERVSLLYSTWTSMLSETDRPKEFELEVSTIPNAPHFENCKLKKQINERLDRHVMNESFPPWTSWIGLLDTHPSSQSNEQVKHRRHLDISEGAYPPWVLGSNEENYPLTRKVQRDIWIHQHPPNCRDPNIRFLVADWERLPGFGIGAQIAGMCGLLAIAIKEKRVLVTNYFNRADHDGCQGPFRSSWSCYFFPETSQECRDRAMELLKDEKVSKSGIVTTKESYNSKEIWTGQTPRIWGDPWSYLQPTTEINGSLIANHRKMDRRWWRAQAVRYLMRFQTEYTCLLMNTARHAAFGKEAARMVLSSLNEEWPKGEEKKVKYDIEKFVWSNGKPWLPRPLVSMHVRMGDKACEMKVVDFEDYMLLADRIRLHFPHINSIWLSTEMQEAIDKTKNYSSWKFYYTNVARQVGNMTMAKYEASLGRETSTNYPLVNFLMASEADFFIGALGSTWCFLIDGMRNTGGKVMAGYLSVNKDRFW